MKKIVLRRTVAENELEIDVFVVQREDMFYLSNILFSIFINKS